ncbi:hypothetical protein HYE55_10135 [Aggregatibacter actinomycetemcomitans]|uniref:hypothetical protein n=1 Tax=Aggregatibacter actinomycetemcomitans TaxID=714 RepID=UPI00197B7889|nr:hypothetical protein [Aggregatibacter actinomycetemcomitans]MBN6082392.1 hypothetical protein [Aggregatibacter actinomycetemcomitans]
MLDIKGELLRLEQQRKQEYISIIELLDFIKIHNHKSSFQEIATYLLIKLTPNDVRKTDYQIWGDDEYEEWIKENGIEVFYVSNNLDCPPEPRYANSFFEALETVRNHDDIHLWGGDDIEDKAESYLQEDQKMLFVKRERIENLLGIKTIDPQKQKELEDELAQKQFTYEERLAEKDKRIAELESQLQKQGVVNYDDFSIYGHTTTEIKAIFAVIQRYWINHDIRQPDTIANAEDIKNWIRENFTEISDINVEAI